MTNECWAGSDKGIAEFPYLVRVTRPYPDRLTYYRTEVEYFRTRGEACKFYNAPKKGLSAELLMHNGKEPGKHLDMIARRKIGRRFTPAS